MNRKFFLQLCATFILLMASISTALAAETWVTDPKTGAKIGWSASDWTITALAIGDPGRLQRRQAKLTECNRVAFIRLPFHSSTELFAVFYSFRQ